MSDVNVDPHIAANTGAVPETYTPAGPSEGGDFNSPTDAARALGNWREKQTGAPKEAAEETPSRDGDAEPVEAGDDGADETAETPAIDPPRSWTKEEKEAFKALPPEHQQRIADRERERDAEIRRRQDEIAEYRKATDADRQAALQVKQQYEQALPHLLQSLYAQQAGEFADIRTWDDVRKLSQEDWPRYVQYDAWQKQMGAVKAQMQQANSQRQQQYNQWLEKWQSEQDRLFTEKAPEFADPKKSAEIQSGVINYLKEIGFKEAEIRNAYATNPQFRDHRMQLIIRDAARLKSALAKAEAKKASPEPIPQVQRPGTASSRGERSSVELKSLDAKLERTGSLKDAAALLMAQRRSARRA